MPTTTLNGVRCHFIEQGRGAETVVFAHGVLMQSALFAAQLAHLARTSRCIALDWRGHGRVKRCAPATMLTARSPRMRLPSSVGTAASHGTPWLHCACRHW